MPTMTLELEIVTRKPYGSLSVNIIEFNEDVLQSLDHDEKLFNAPEMLSAIKQAVFGVIRNAGFNGE